MNEMTCTNLSSYFSCNKLISLLVDEVLLMQYQLSKHAQCANLYYVTLVPLLLIPESVSALVLVLVSV